MKKLYLHDAPYAYSVLLFLLGICYIVYEIEYKSLHGTELLLKIILIIVIDIVLSWLIFCFVTFEINFKKKYIRIRNLKNKVKIDLDDVSHFEFYEDYNFRIVMNNGETFDEYCRVYKKGHLLFENKFEKYSKEYIISRVKKANKMLVEYRKQNNLD